MHEHQEYERDWWGGCTNTFSEEAKQITYAHHMGLVNTSDPHTGRWPCYDLAGRSVLDLGGGPTSLLLKTVNRDTDLPSAVVDPCPYPRWVMDRYFTAGLVYHPYPAERFNDGNRYDEVWIYNVLQHVEDPEQVIATARSHGALLRIFEWIDLPPSLGHPHMLTKASLDAWIGGDGTAAWVNENSAVGQAYYGVFAL